MNPTLVAQSIAEQHLAAAPAAARLALAEDIRWAIIQGQIAARQPPELPPSMASTIVYRILHFVDEYRARLGSGAPELENLLRQARAEVCALHGITPVEDAPVGGQRKPMARAAELKRGAGA
ncbi:MAG: hypothetical protein ACLPWF_04720 [Bryobacteraceae bacterium]|jgi:hypothetical protein